MVWRLRAQGPYSHPGSESMLKADDPACLEPGVTVTLFSGHASAAQLPKGRHTGQECRLGRPGRLHLRRKL